jgi:FkbM family methyltransferase
VAEFQGEFQLGVRSDLFKRIISEGAYERDLARVCLSHLEKDQDVIDVGANIGFYTVLFAKNIGHRRVLSVEPTDEALRRLRNNIERNGISDKVVIFEGIAWDQEGAAEIKVVPNREEYSSIGEMRHPAVEGQEYSIKTVRGATLDYLVEHHSLNPGFIKIDVEGAEHRVLKGARNVLKKYKPIILSELADPLLRKNGSSSKAVLAELERNGYRVVDPIEPTVPPGCKEYSDILCIPSAPVGSL